MASVSPGINNLKGKKLCQFCGQYFKGIKIHISKAHPEQYRQSLLNAQTCIKNQDDQIDQSTTISTSKSERVLPQTDKSYQHELEKWLPVFSKDMTELEFNENISSFLKFLSEAVNHLPGPKNPNTRYYEARKRGQFKNNNYYNDYNRQYSSSTNPQRASKNDRERRKAKFNYEQIQFDYFYQRRKAVRKVLQNQNSCKLNVDKQLIETFYRKKFEFPNLKVRCSYDSQANADEIDVIELSPDFVFSIIKSIAVDTSPGQIKFC